MASLIIKTPKAPVLPNTAEVYTRQYQDQFNNILRLYFNQLDAYVVGAGSYGAFSSGVDQTLVAANTPQLVTYDSTDVSSGVTLGSSASQIVCGYGGVYNFQFSFQIESVTASSRTLAIWPRINGVDVPNSATNITIKSNSDIIVPAWNFVLEMLAGDYFELVWASDGNNVFLSAHPVQASPYVRPAIPSVILTVSQVK